MHSHTIKDNIKVDVKVKYIENGTTQAQLAETIGMTCKKGNTFSRYVFNLSKYLEQASVKEILSCLYSGENFEGFDRVHLPYHRLDDIFNGRILPTYYEALKKITGVYCLTDTYAGRLYIGSATGEEGVAQRWGGVTTLIPNMVETRN